MDRTDAWAVRLETGGREGGVILAVMADGTATLCTEGRSDRRAFDSESVRAASESLLELAQQLGPDLSPASETGPRLEERCVIYVRTASGTLAAAAPEKDFVDGRHPASPLFHGALEVIAAIAGRRDT